MTVHRWIAIEDTPPGDRFPGFRVVIHHLTPLAKTTLFVRNFWIKDTKDVKDPIEARTKAEEFADALSKITEIEFR